jgi:RNA polymerase sigma factor for flagellar operon FliA
MPDATRASPNELAERNVSLVIHVARDYGRRLPPGVNFGDLVGAGNLGLVEAARRFDPAKGASFATFARHRIRGAIIDSLRRLDPVSRRLRSFQKAAKQATDALTVKLGREPSNAEVAAQVGLAAYRFERLSRELGEVGCDATGFVPAKPVLFSVDGLPARSDSPDRRVELAELRKTLVGALQTLPQRDRMVVRWRHFDGLTVGCIAAKLGISESRTNQIHSAAIRRLREHSELRERA